MIEYKCKAIGRYCPIIIIIGCGVVIALPISSLVSNMIYNGTVCDFMNNFDYCVQLGGDGLVYFVVNILFMLVTIGPYLLAAKLKSDIEVSGCVKTIAIIAFGIL